MGWVAAISLLVGLAKGFHKVVDYIAATDHIHDTYYKITFLTILTKM